MFIKVNENAPKIERTVKCAVAIEQAYTIAKFGSDGETMMLADSPEDKAVGVFQHTTTRPGEEVKVMILGVGRLRLTETVKAGERIMSIAVALRDGNAGDVITALIVPR